MLVAWLVCQLPMLISWGVGHAIANAFRGSKPAKKIRGPKLDEVLRAMPGYYREPESDEGE